jgi:hypothetical protein
LSDAAVGLSTLLSGYQQAYNRWMMAPRIDTDPEQAFIAIFDALNWAVVIDDRLRTALRGRWPSGYAEGDYLLDAPPPPGSENRAALA